MSDANKEGQTDLPAGWAFAPLEEICQINPQLDRCIVNDAVEVNFVPMRAVEPEGGGLIRPEMRHHGEVKKGYTSFISGDVIMAKITPCMENGKTTVVPDLPGSICFGSTEFHVMRPESGVTARWIANFLIQHEVRRTAQRAMTGGVGQMRVPAAFLETVRIPVAPSAEQERTADALDELLSDLDAGVAALERVRGKLKLYRASVLKAAVEGALTAEWRKQHPHAEPASELLKHILAERRRCWEEEQLRKFKEEGRDPPTTNWKAKYKEPVAPDTSNLPPLPEDWCWASIDQLSSQVRNGYSLKPNATSGVPILRISAVRSFALDLADVRYLSGAPSDYSESLIRPRDLLFTRYNGTRGLVGVCAIVPDINKAIVHPDKLIRARPLPIVAVPAFIALAANVGESRKFIAQRIRTTAGQAGVSGSDVKELPVPLPPSFEQEMISEAVEDQLSIIEHLEADLDAKVTSTQALRQAILRHAFTGKLVPRNPSDEPASELLKRIAAEREQRVREAVAAKRPNGRRPRQASAVRIPGKAGRTVTKETINGRIADR
jgi:type I restriction enzyme S subunit